MSPHLRSLHWLPVKQRIKFKWCLLIFKTLKFGLPPYFSPYFVPYTCKISTWRSAPSKHILSLYVVPCNRNIHKFKLHFDNSFAASGLKGCDCDSIGRTTGPYSLYTTMLYPLLISIVTICPPIGATDEVGGRTTTPQPHLI